MTVKTKNGIFDCEKISLEKIGKDFEIETDCKVLIEFSADSISYEIDLSTLDTGQATIIYKGAKYACSFR